MLSIFLEKKKLSKQDFRKKNIFCKIQKLSETFDFF